MLRVFFLVWGLYAAWGVELEKPEMSQPTVEVSDEASDTDRELNPMCCNSPPPPCPPACGGSGG